MGYDRSITRQQYNQLRREAYIADRAAHDPTIGYADSPGWVQARADDFAREARARVPKPLTDYKEANRVARAVNRRRRLIELLKERRWHRLHGMPTGHDTYQIRTVLDPSYPEKEMEARTAAVLGNLHQ